MGRRGILGIGSFVVLALVAVVAPTQADTGRPRSPDRLDRVAAVNGLSRAQVSDLLRDPTLRIGKQNRLIYRDVHSAIAPGPDAAHTTTQFPLSQTFALHTRPSSPYTIYLDFNGYQVPKGTYWAEDYGTAPLKGYDLKTADGGDSNPATFNDEERTRIQTIWSRVAEDFAPFNVDVTTEDPGSARLNRFHPADGDYGMRVAIIDRGIGCPTFCTTGEAVLDIFDEQVDSYRFHPAWAYADSTLYSSPAIANVISHEVGHTLGLVHDSQEPGDGEYYGGHGIWAPLMGTENPAVTQWSKGEYTNAVNYGTSGDEIARQDDLALMAAALGWVPDDVGGDLASAISLGRGDAIGAEGVIGRSTDVDVFKIVRGCSDTLTVTAAPTSFGPNVDLKLELLDSNGAVLATANPDAGSTGSPAVATGLGASLSRTNAFGTYYIRIDGVGGPTPTSNPSNGYSDYDSLGRYEVTANGCAGETSVPTPVTDLQVRRTATTSAKVTWDQPVGHGGQGISGYQVRVGGTLKASPTGQSVTLTNLARGKTLSIDVRALNASGAGTPATVPITLPAPFPGKKPGTVTMFRYVVELPGPTTVVTYTKAKARGTKVIRYQIVSQKLKKNGKVAKTYVGLSLGTQYYAPFHQGRFRIKVRAFNAKGWGAYSKPKTYQIR